MSFIHQTFSYFNYWLNEENEHSLHSPFIYELYKKVILDTNRKPLFPDIEKVREQFALSTNTIEVVDLGSGSNVSKNNQRKISDIATKGISKRKFSELYERLIRHFDYNIVVELGTSLGVNTLYLSKNKDSRVFTFEGDPSLAAIASAVFEGNEKTNTEVIEGNIDQTLPLFLNKYKKVDFALIDANHTYKATLAYFNLFLSHISDHTCLVFDDVHINREMEKAWNEIKSHYQVTVTIDLFQVGLVFFNPEIRKQDFILTF
ncbi:class I SAM-dependent methyltransferase [Fulvivirga sp.]|uniref:class I SAM-dependent methyltransferase n=1 Tax=Fulvivirga sp. TaxID=1931237 RepID=UPI0032EF0C79